MLLFRAYYTFSDELADLRGKSASLHLEIIRKLLTVKGDLKASVTRLSRAYRKISEKLFASGTLGGDVELLKARDVLPCELLHQVEYKLTVKCAVVRAGVEYVRGIHEHNDAFLGGDDRNGERACLGTGKSLSEDRSRRGLR